MTKDDFAQMRMNIQHAINEYNSYAHEHNRGHQFKDYVPIMCDYELTRAFPTDYEKDGIYYDYN